MTIDETKKVLSFIWSCFPSAPKLSREDKDRMILSFFRVLYRYSKNDVINAVIDTCKGSKGFAPSVFELEKHIKISAPEYEFLETDREKYLYKKYYLTNVFFEINNPDADQKEIAEFLQIYPDIQTRRDSAYARAEKAYYAANINAASQDIKDIIGVEHGEKISKCLE